MALIARGTIIKKTGTTRTEKIPYISSLLEPKPLQFLAIARSQWRIENSFFNVRDVTFREDSHPMHAGNGPFNMAMARNFAISISHLLGHPSLPATFSIANSAAPKILSSLRLSG
jgi:predicted transposase YbfD/YdcC